MSSSEDVGDQIASQLLNDPKALWITAAVLGMVGLIPGMPNLVFLLLGGAVGGLAYVVGQRHLRAAAPQPASLPEPEETGNEPRELTWDDVQPVDIIGLEVGYRLIPLVDRSQGGQLMNRIKGVRKKLSEELGFLVLPVYMFFTSPGGH